MFLFSMYSMYVCVQLIDCQLKGLNFILVLIYYDMTYLLYVLSYTYRFYDGGFFQPEMHV